MQFSCQADQLYSFPIPDMRLWPDDNPRDCGYIMDVMRPSILKLWTPPALTHLVVQQAKIRHQNVDTALIFFNGHIFARLPFSTK